MLKQSKHVRKHTKHIDNVTIITPAMTETAAHTIRSVGPNTITKVTRHGDTIKRRMVAYIRQSIGESKKGLLSWFSEFVGSCLWSHASRALSMCTVHTVRFSPAWAINSITAKGMTWRIKSRGRVNRNNGISVTVKSKINIYSFNIVLLSILSLVEKWKCCNLKLSSQCFRILEITRS